VTASLAIGDFSRATQLSVKTLRNYHRLGLLEPTEVDPDTGYRRYTIGQIPAAQIIRRFRKLDMPLDQIAAMLRASDVRERNAVIAAHLTRLEDQLAHTRAAVSSLRSLLEGPPPALDVTHRSEPSLETAAISSVIALGDLGAWFQGAIGELYGTAGAQRVGAAGPPGAMIANEFFADDYGEVTVFLPVGRPLRPVGRVTPTRLPATELATITHHGSHEDVDRAYGALGAYVSERAIVVDGPIRERYLVGRHDTPDENRWRTEIGWPIFDTARNPEETAAGERTDLTAIRPAPDKQQ
jgi:DNA-binding transcriptional MerR regulator